MLRVRILAVVIAIALSVSAVHAEDETYAYPYRDPYMATVTAAIVSSEEPGRRVKRQAIHVPVLPGRNRVRSLEGRGELSVSLYRQHRAAPLIFILSGVGSNPYFGLATYFAKLFHQQGSHVVILPSPMTWNFALAASRSGAPGYAPDDARDLYEAMQKTLPVLKSQHDVRVTRVHFLGASLGALQGAYVSVIDAEEQKIGIERYLLINPPLDLYAALKRTDEWLALREKFGREKSKTLVGSAVAIVQSFSKERRDDPAVFDRFVKAFARFTTEEIQFLIAQDLQASLPELLSVTQIMQEQNVVTTGKGEVRKRLQEEKYATFVDYSETVAVPLWRLQTGELDADLETFTRRGSLRSILDRLRGNARVHIMHNADDFMADPRSIEELKEALGNQVTIYPYGGHLGNLWYRVNRDEVLRRFSASP